MTIVSFMSSEHRHTIHSSVYVPGELTTCHAVVRIGFNIPTVGVQSWVQDEECLESDPVFLSYGGTCMFVDLPVFRIGVISTVDFTGGNVSGSNDAADGDRRRRRGLWIGNTGTSCSLELAVIPSCWCAVGTGCICKVRDGKTIERKAPRPSCSVK